MAHAEKRRQERLEDRTAGELMFADILRALNIGGVPEKIFQNGDSNVIVDFYLPAHKLAVEIDGSSHDDKGAYDSGRDRWLAGKHGIRTMRLRNEFVLGRPITAMLHLSSAIAVREICMRRPESMFNS